jgi:hypothetical protein
MKNSVGTNIIPPPRPKSPPINPPMEPHIAYKI